MKQTLFITGTDTGVGKTVLTVLLVKFLRGRGVNAAALKPICSGGRGDARKIFAAMDGAVGVRSLALSLDEINPLHFRATVAPLLAARREKKKVKLSQVLAHARAMQKRFDVLLIEGAGGLLSPLGENFNSRDLILALRAMPIVVAQNKLGAVNQALLTLEALPEKFRAQSKVVLVAPPKPDAATNSNAKLLGQFFDPAQIYSLPWFGENFDLSHVLEIPRVQKILGALA
jgi:dethiobiotin synthetase